MDLAASFVLALVGGYFLSLVWRLTRFSTRRLVGHHLYFRAALSGAIVFLIALGLRTWAVHISAHYATIDRELVNYVKPLLKDGVGRADWVVAAAYSLALGPFCGLLLNAVTPYRWAHRRSLGTLDLLLLKAQDDDLAVQVTLKSGKVYVGSVIAITDPDREPDAVKLLPLFSGFRDSEQRMILIEDYERVYRALLEDGADEHLSQFQLVVRTDSIVTVTLFSPVVYARFNPTWNHRRRLALQRGAQEGDR